MSLFPGLPALPSDFTSLLGDVALLVSDALAGFPGSSQQQWGIFLDGSPVVLADNVVSFDFRQDFAISNYPIEQGAFASYNKVQKPFEVKIRFSTGGSPADREKFFQSINAVIGDTNLYQVVTPEIVYDNLNFIHQDYRRTATDGAGLISIDVWCEEVRPASIGFSGISATDQAPSSSTTNISVQPGTGQTGFGSPVNPSASASANDGNVTPGSSQDFSSSFGAFN